MKTLDGTIGGFCACLRRETKGDPITLERYLRLIAGLFVVASLILGYWVSPYWFLFTAFVGLNLVQSAFTNWCPMMTFLRRVGVRELRP